MAASVSSWVGKFYEATRRGSRYHLVASKVGLGDQFVRGLLVIRAKFASTPIGGSSLWSSGPS